MKTKISKISKISKMSKIVFSFIFICLSLVVVTNVGALTFNGFQYEYTEDETGVIITGYIGSDTEIIIPDTIDEKPVIEIADNAFVSNTTMTKITFGANVTRLGDQALYKCTGLTGTIELPTNITTIGEDAFKYTSLDKVIHNSKIVYGKTADGLMYEPNDDYTEMSITGHYLDNKNGLNIPSEIEGMPVTTIKAYAFAEKENIKGELTLPNTLKIIEKSAFEETGLSGDLVIPDSVTYVGEYAFWYNENMRSSITLSKNLTELTSHSFGNNNFSGQLVLPEKLTTIGDHAFSDCEEFRGDLVIPNSVTYIGKFAFSTFGLDIDTVHQGVGKLILNEGLEHIDDGAFNGATFNGTLDLPSTLTRIGENAFCNNNLLTGNLIIPENITVIESQAFYCCSGFDGILKLPSKLTRIESYAFKSCSGLTGKLTLPSTLERIDGDAFNNCTGFRGNLTIPQKVTEIGEGAFWGCTGLTGNLIIPDNVTILGSGAFAFCTGFDGTLYISKNLKAIKWATFERCEKLTGDITIPNSVTSIGDEAFLDCTGFNGILTIGNSVQEIGKNTFFNKENKPNSITKIQFTGNAPVVIGTNAFPLDTVYYVEGSVGYENIGYKTVPYTSNDENIVWMKDLVIDEIQPEIYSKYEIEPKLTVRDGDKVLVLDTDYTVKYSNNVEVGTATVTITGIGYYLGNTTTNFNITYNMRDVSVEKIADQVYTGKEITPKVVVTHNSATLQEGIDYTLSYSNNVEIGKGTITITGIGKYSRTKQVNFNIKRDINDYTVLAIDNQVYTGSEIKPNITVKDGDKTLYGGYKVTYTNNIEKGVATVTITGTNDNIGTREVSFVIGTDIKNVNVEPIGDAVYSGSPVEPKFNVKDGDKGLIEGVDYILTYSNNNAVGTATVKVKGIGQTYAGTKSVSFKIYGDISVAEVSKIETQTYTGSKINPSTTLTLNGKTLYYGVDYDRVITNNINAGVATITYTGIGDYRGTKTVTFNIVGQDISTLIFGEVNSVEYTGKEITPKITIRTANYTTLVEGTDYTLAYSNNVNVGTATITITGKGNYTGTKVVTFKIVEPEVVLVDIVIATVNAIENKTYTGAAITPNPVVKVGSTTLVENTDYTLTYSNNVNVGQATITITGKGNYTGTKVVTFKIVEPEVVLVDISTATVNAIADKTYTGVGITPKPVVKVGSTTLVEGTDYTLTYSNNVNVGTATITITGKGNYTGTKVVTFKIVEPEVVLVDISTATVNAIADKTYTGVGITPKPVVKVGSTTLVEGTDYTLTYDSNVNVGTATITITGKGNYTGTKVVTFKIVEPEVVLVDISTATVNAIADKTYTGVGITPKPVVKVGSTTLVEGTDYTLTYDSNVNVGTATITITGKGNYTGTKTVTFKIVKAETEDYGYVNFSLDKTVSYDRGTVTVRIIAAKAITDYEIVLTLDNITENITIVNKLAGSNAKIKGNTVTMYMIQLTSQADKTIYPAGTVLAEITYKIPDGYFEANKGFDGTAIVVNTCAIRITDNAVNYEYSLTENVTVKEINIQEVLQETLKKITIDNNTVDHIKVSLEQSTGLTVIIKDKDGNTLDTTDKMGTGTTVAIVDEKGNTISTQTVSIHGEIDGDGEVNFFDIITMISLIYDTEDYVWEEAFRSAAKFGEEGEPNFFDIMNLIQHIYE